MDMRPAIRSCCVFPLPMHLPIGISTMQTSIAGAVVMGAVVGLLASLSQQSNVTTLYTTQAPQLAATAQSGIQPVVARPPTVTPRVHNVMGATMMPSMDTLSQSYGSTSLGSTPLPSTTRSWTLLSCGMALCLATYAIFRRSKVSPFSPCVDWLSENFVTSVLYSMTSRKNVVPFLGG